MNQSSTSLSRLRHVVLAFAALASIVPATQAHAAGLDWFGGNRIEGSGNIKSLTRELGHFTGVAVNLPSQVELRIGNTESVTIETDDNLLPLIESVVEDGTLKLRTGKRNLNFKTRTLKIVVHARSIDRIALGGSGTIESDVLRGDKFKFDIGGSGSINLKGIEGNAVVVAVGGSGNLRSGPGTAGKVSVSIGGSGDVQLGQVKAQDANVSVAGSGEATLWVSGALSASIAGSGDVNYYGDPKVSKSVAGSGTLKRLGDSGR